MSLILYSFNSFLAIVELILALVEYSNPNCVVKNLYPFFSFFLSYDIGMKYPSVLPIYSFFLYLFATI